MIIQAMPYPASGGITEVTSFDLIATSPNNVNAWQGVAWTGTHYFTTAEFTSATAQFTLQKYDPSWTQVDFRDMGSDGDATQEQITGIYYDPDADKLYVCANNYPSTPDQGWVFEVDPDDLSVLTYHDLGAKWTEAVVPWNGSWWEVNASGHEIRQFNSSWVLQATHTLPDSSPGALYWQGIWVVNDIFYVNLHASAGGGLRAYEWNGSGFDAVATSESRPSTSCTQGTHFDGDFIYWAERIGTWPPLVGHVRVTSAYESLRLYSRPVTAGRVDQTFKGFTIAGSGGTEPYTYSVQTGSLPAGLSLNSSTGEISGTPSSAGTSSGIVLRVTDDVGATVDSDAFAITIAAALSPWEEIARQETLKEGTLPVLGLDLTGLSAIRIHLVGVTVTSDDSYVAIDLYSGGRILTGYQWGATSMSTGGTTGTQANGSAERISLTDTTSARGVGNASTESLNAVVAIDNPAGASQIKKVATHAVYIAPSGNAVRMRDIGTLDISGPVDSIIVYSDSDLTGGKVIVTALN